MPRRSAGRESGVLADSEAGTGDVHQPDDGYRSGASSVDSYPDQLADLWHARLAVKTLRKDQRKAIAEAGGG